MKNIGIFILIVVILGGIMFFTNPTKDNFNNFLERKASRNIAKYVGGTHDAVDELIHEGEPITAYYADTNYVRDDYYVFSIYTSKSSTYNTRYLGLFKLFMKMD